MYHFSFSNKKIADEENNPRKRAQKSTSYIYTAKCVCQCYQKRVWRVTKIYSNLIIFVIIELCFFKYSVHIMASSHCYE